MKSLHSITLGLLFSGGYITPSQARALTPTPTDTTRACGAGCRDTTPAPPTPACCA